VKEQVYVNKEEFPAEHLTRLKELAMIFGKDEIHIHHYVLKLFPFCLGGDAKK
jgi:hypothetical protein